jgi:hypothetical protein
MIERENPDRSSYGYYGRPAGAPGSREDLIVTAHALGTAIIESPYRAKAATGQSALFGRYEPTPSVHEALKITAVCRLDKGSRNRRQP